MKITHILTTLGLVFGMILTLLQIKDMVYKSSAKQYHLQNIEKRLERVESVVNK